MEEERLKNEIRKVREAYSELESNSQLRIEELLNENKLLKNTEHALKRKINEFEEKLINCQQENEVLLVSKRDLCENIRKSEQGTFRLEEQLTQLRLELDNVKAQNTQYERENAELNECLLNANNLIEEKEAQNSQYVKQNADLEKHLVNANRNERILEEKLEEIKRLEKQILMLKEENSKLSDKINDLSAELQGFTLDRDSMLEALQKNKKLTADNNRLRNDLIESLKSNDELQTQTYESEQQVLDLQLKLNAATKTIENLEKRITENLENIEKLTETLTNAQANLKETTEERDSLKMKSHLLETQLTEIDLSHKNLQECYKSATEQLLVALDKKTQLEKELKIITGRNQNGNTIDDLKVALITCLSSTQKVLHQLDNIPEGFTNVEIADRVNV